MTMQVREARTPEPELIVLQRPAHLRPPTFGLDRRAEGLYEVVRLMGLDIVPIFEAGTTQPPGRGIDAAQQPPFFRVLGPSDELEEIKRRLHRTNDVAAAYIKPPVAAPSVVNTMQPTGAPPVPVTPDFSPRQEFTRPAPQGVDRAAAWARPGGRGSSVTIGDVEGGWHLDHEALDGQIDDASGVGAHPDWVEHGTAVMAVCLAAESGIGVTGLAPEANGLVASALDAGGSAAAVRTAADRLEPGDVLMIELHRAGPRHGFQPRNDQAGYIAVEWWPDDLAVVQYALSRGVIVVEAAGNGGENLSDALYAAGSVDFPSDWQDPFSVVDSGAILVGAGAPPVGTHGHDWGPERSRLDFSNFGSRLDAQGWGREVTTAGYGDLQGGPDPNTWYTDEFAGTSSATPIVAGVVACLQGAARQRGRSLTPDEVRDLLRRTGSAQAGSGAGVQRIGSLPDLAVLMTELDTILPSA